MPCCGGSLVVVHDADDILKNGNLKVKYVGIHNKNSSETRDMMVL